MRPRSSTTRRGSTGPGRRRPSTTRSAACRPFPAPGSRSIWGKGPERLRCCARASPKARARPARCSTMASRRLRRGRGAAPRRCSGPARRRCRRGEFLRGVAGSRRAQARLMPRYKLLIEYDGTPYVGWQRQANGRAVQQAVEDAIARVLRRGPCASRAPGAPMPACMRPTRSPSSTSRATGRPTRVRDASTRICAREPRRHPGRRARSTDDFDARFSAQRAPLPLPHRQPPPAPGARADRAWHCRRPLDAAAMHDAAQALVGQHDFTTFRSADCQAASPVKTLTGSMSSAWARRSASTRRRAPSCTTRCARWWARCRWSAAGRWTGATSPPRWRRATARAAAHGAAGGLYLVGVDY